MPAPFKANANATPSSPRMTAGHAAPLPYARSNREDDAQRLVLPPQGAATPCLVIYEDAVRHNLEAMVARCGSVERLMPHIKTHRAAWIVSLLAQSGVNAFKVATIAEAAMVLSAGARRLVWAYPTVNQQHIGDFLSLARQHPQVQLGALVDSSQGLDAWQRTAGPNPWPANLALHVDLDPGMGRTGAAIGNQALALAQAICVIGGPKGFGGWHVYDGHINDRDIEVRRTRVIAVAAMVRSLVEKGREDGLSTEVIAGASYSFDLWPEELATFVGPGSWVYSSSQHDVELKHLQWRPAAFVLATVVSRHGARVTLDAGSKAISPDKPMGDRFRWDSPIVMMNEEHTVVEAQNLDIGDRVLLLPRHACTTAYLYDRALVRTADARWEIRAQLGSQR